ncbi:hypothetical protein [Flavobacterium sp.]|uniref:hypothetical protein n=1 Tax=Flavobacterium sp. TaxID=239 RepID=UPI002FDD41EE
MKRFILNTLKLAILFTGMVYLIQWGISYRISGKTVTGYDTLECTENVNADLVLLGSSRCWAHFDPEFFQSNYRVKTVNIGMNGHPDILASHLRFENYLARNKAPKYAILTMDPFVSAGNLEKNSNMVNKNDYARFAFMPNTMDEPLLQYFKFDAAERYVPLYALCKYQMFWDCITLNKSDSFPKGFELNDEEWDTLKYPITSENKKYFFKESDIPDIKKALMQFKQLCQKHQVKLLCIQTPTYKAVYDSESFNWPGAICKELNIPFFDANYEAIRNKTVYFYNTNHLNRTGVLEMNSRLKNAQQLTDFFKINP